MYTVAPPRRGALSGRVTRDSFEAPRVMDPTGRRALVLGEEGMWIDDAQAEEDAEPLMWKGVTDEWTTLTWAPGGRSLLMQGAENGWMVWRVGTDGEVRAWKDAGNVSAYTIDPVGASAALGAGDGTAWVRPLDADGAPERLHTSDSAIELLSLDAPGEVLFADADGTVMRVKAERVHEMHAHSGAPSVLTVARDGSWFVSGDEEGLRLWAPQGTKAPTRATGIPVTGAWIAGDGDGVLDEAGAGWYVGDATAPRGFKKKNDRFGKITNVAFRGSDVITVRRDLEAQRLVVHVQDEERAAIDVSGVWPVQTAIALSSTGRYVAFGTGEETLMVGRTDGASGLKSPKGHKGRITYVQFSPGETRLVSTDDAGRILIQPLGGVGETLTAKFKRNTVTGLLVLDEERALVAMASGPAQWLNLRDGSLTPWTQGPEGIVRFWRGGDISGFAVQTEDGQLAAFDKDGTRRASWSDVAPVEQVAWILEGRILATLGAEGKVAARWIEGSQPAVNWPMPWTGLALHGLEDGNLLIVDERGIRHRWMLDPAVLLAELDEKLDTCLNAAVRQDVLGQSEDEAMQGVLDCEEGKQPPVATVGPNDG